MRFLLFGKVGLGVCGKIIERKSHLREVAERKKMKKCISILLVMICDVFSFDNKLKKEPKLQNIASALFVSEMRGNN